MSRVSVGVLVNAIDDIDAKQTTALLGAELVRREDVEVTFFGVADLGIAPDGRVVARGRRAEDVRTAADVLCAIVDADDERVVVEDLDGLLIRTNPARDTRAWAHQSALEMARFVRAAGVVVINDPDGLALASSKLFLTRFPEWTRPATLVSSDRAELGAFLRGLPGAGVVKPAFGTRGSDVFQVTPDDKNLHQILDVLLRQGYVVAQAFVPEATAGDTRVIVLDGEILEIEGAPLAVRRIPGREDFRSNVHVGGTPARGVVSEGMRAVVAAYAPLLRAHGLHLVGLDFLGDLVCEINVFSAGGFGDAERFAGKAYVTAVAERFLAHIQAGVERRRAAKGEGAAPT